MKVVFLAGGLATRISEESHLVPKPLIKIGGKPILWHIMQYYASYGHKDFIILAGYKQEVIKDYFFNYYLHNSDVRFNLKDRSKELVKSYSDDWVVTVLDTGLITNTAGRLLRAKEHLINEESFLLTYGDGLSNININKLIKFHKINKSIVTLSAVKPTPHFGRIIFKGNKVIRFLEKDKKMENWINGGFFVCNKEVFKYLNKKNVIFESVVLELLAKKKKLAAYKHKDFWYCMDTLRDKRYLNNLWFSKKAPWKIWNEE
jgi:glucose-1-phosphate cytidylyltransferase